MNPAVTPNVFAYLALLAWIPLTLLLFTGMRPAVAAAATLLAGQLILPGGVSFNLPGLPPVGREEIATFAAILSLLVLRPRLLRFWHHAGVPELFLFLMLVGPFLTAFANSDPLSYGPTKIQGLTPYDGLGMAFHAAMSIGFPFLLGRELIRRPADVRRVLVFFVGFALAYSVLVLWEARMSPQLHRVVYGFHQVHFGQAVRAGGWRPTVFASHGIDLSLFIATAAIAALGLARARIPLLRIPASPAGVYLMGVLAICRSLGSLVYGVIFAPVVFFLKPRLQLRLAVLAALFVLLYPLLRTADVFPTDTMISAARSVSEARAQSLQTRFDHEERLLEKARERVVLGWGRWGRHRIYDERSGRDVSLTDGFWIVELGAFGLLRFASVFGLLLWPIFLAERNIWRIPSQRDRILFATVAVILTIRTVDLLPNAFLSSFAVFLAGGLHGAVRAYRPAEQLPSKAMGADPKPAPSAGF